MKILKTRELSGVNRCSERRESELKLSSGKHLLKVYDEAALAKGIIKDAVYHPGTLDEDEVRKHLEEGYESFEYPTPQTKLARMEDCFMQIMRYINSETRKPLYSPERGVVPFAEIVVFNAMKAGKIELVKLPGDKQVKCRINPCNRVFLVHPYSFDSKMDSVNRIHALYTMDEISQAVTAEIESMDELSRRSIYSAIDAKCMISVHPDFIFRGIQEFEREMLVPDPKYPKKLKKIKYKQDEEYLEIVKLCCKRPNVTLTGKRKDSGAKQNLELYSMLLYGRPMVKKILETESVSDINLGASFYFLRKDSDGKEFDQDFFNEKNRKNIVTLWEKHYNKLSADAHGMDQNFGPQLKSFLEGETELDCDTCEKCEFYQSCYYKKAPIKLEQELKKKSISDIQLTDIQEGVVGFREGFGLAIAGAGAGKTASIALRTAYMLEEGNDAKRICMITFTNNGAAEMRTRIHMYAEDLDCDELVKHMTITTFNGLGNEIVKENYEELGFTEVPRLIDNIERLSIIRKLIAENTVPGLDYRNFKMNMPYVKGALYTTSKAFEIMKRKELSGGEKELTILQEEMLHAGYSLAPESAVKLMDLYAEYDGILHERNLIEFADQELLVMELLRKYPFYFEDYGFEHIIVDEYQDTNDIQIEILRRMIDTPHFKSLLAVGDDSQSIFAFRGSNPKHIVNFFEEFDVPDDERNFFPMMHNFRSVPNIIDFANDIVSRNRSGSKEAMLPARPDNGKPVVVKQFWKKEDEERYIIKKMREKHAAGVKWEDMAYIASTRNELMTMAAICADHEIPTVMLNPEPFLENSRVIAAISLVKYMKDSTSTLDAFIYLNALYKNTLRETCSDYQISHNLCLLQETVEEILATGNYAALKGMFDALDDADEIYDKFKEAVFIRTTVDEVLDYVMDYDEFGEGETAKREQNYPGVVLTTAHSSKGLEWNIVFNSVTKYHTKKVTAEDVEERRRLLFVSATRARDELYITGQTIAYGSKERVVKGEVVGGYTYNLFLTEAMDAVGETLSLDNPYDKATLKSK